MRVFIAGPLLRAQGLDLDFYTRIGTACSDAGWEPFLPHLRIDQTLRSDSIFLEDVKAVAGCDLIIAEVSSPSHGVGGELMQAYLNRLPIVCLALEGQKVSSMVLGNPMVEKTITYKTKEACLEILKDYLRSRREG